MNLPSDWTGKTHEERLEWLLQAFLCQLTGGASEDVDCAPIAQCLIDELEGGENKDLEKALCDFFIGKFDVDLDGDIDGDDIAASPFLQALCEATAACLTQNLDTDGDGDIDADDLAGNPLIAAICDAVKACLIADMDTDGDGDIDADDMPGSPFLQAMCQMVKACENKPVMIPPVELNNSTSTGNTPYNVTALIPAGASPIIELESRTSVAGSGAQVRAAGSNGAVFTATSYSTSLKEFNQGILTPTGTILRFIDVGGGMSIGVARLVGYVN